MKKFGKILLWALVIALAAAAVWLIFLRDEGVAFTEEVARTADIETFYTFTGNLAADGAYVMTATAAGTVSEVLCQEGDDVQADDVLLRLEGGEELTAHMDGTVSHLLVEKGDVFAPGAMLYRVADYSKPYIAFRVDEYDVSAVRKGMTCTVRVLSTGAELEGTIRRVAQEATVVGDLAFYDVTLDVPQDGTLAMGLTCEIIVPRQSVENATTVSMAAIQYDEKGLPFVYRRHREGDVVQVPVTLGINDGKIVEILEGVHTGEIILVPPTFSFDPAAMRERMMEGMQ